MVGGGRHSDPAMYLRSWSILLKMGRRRPRVLSMVLISRPPHIGLSEGSCGTQRAKIFREVRAQGVAERSCLRCTDATQRRSGGWIPTLSVVMVLADLHRIYTLLIIKIKAEMCCSAAWAIITQGGEETVAKVC